MLKIIVVIVFVTAITVCYASASFAAAADNDVSNSVIFPKGEVNPYGQFFKGTSYLNMISLNPACPIGNVTFEPGCRNNWHIHHAVKDGGQILLVTGGRGWYQEWSKPARELKAGDVVQIPANVKHWHGAARDSWFVHLAVEVHGENTKTEWLEPVSDEDYSKLK
jgi:quercetin dioxygenase-like cupin family protein